MPRDFQRPFTLPRGATELVVVRHGSSAGATDGTGATAFVGGASDPPLSERGRRQALAVADRLAGDPIAAIHVTPLRRTAETAAPLAARLGFEPQVVAELREVFLGDWERDFRRRIATKDPLYASVFAAQRWDVIPGAEDMEAFGARVRSGMDGIADAIGPDRIGAVVVHAGVIAEICRQATNSDAFAFLYAENCSITRVLRLRSGRWAMRSFNDVAHLAGLQDDTADAQTRLVGGGLG